MHILGTQLNMPGRLHSGDGYGHNGKVLESSHDTAGFGAYFTWSAEVFQVGMLESLRVAAVAARGDDAATPTVMLDALLKAATEGEKRKVVAPNAAAAGPAKWQRQEKIS